MLERSAWLRVWSCLAWLATAAGCDAAAPPTTSPTGLPVDKVEHRERSETPPENLARRTHGIDWPAFLGPHRDSRSPETGILTDWEQQPPQVVWQVPLEESYGIGSISRGRLVQFDRAADRARATCYHAETGKKLWQFEYPTDFRDLYGYNGGPRCSPVIDGNRVYLLGAEGMLHCVRLTDGKLIWKCDTARQFGVIQNFFGVGSTPIVEGDLLLAIVGGSPPADRRIPPGQLDRVTSNGSGIVAFDKWTGDVRYRSIDELAGYASPVVRTVNGRRLGLAFCRGGLAGFEPATGKQVFSFPWRARILESVNASTPVTVGNQVFISETYGPGSCLLEIKEGSCRVLWQDDPKRRQKAFQAHWNTPIYHEGFLYGCSGRNPPDAELRCIEWSTGKVRWSVPTGARSSMLLIDDYLINLFENGRLQLLRPNPERLEVVSEVMLRASPPPGTAAGLPARALLRYPCWAAPIVAHGLLYVRGADRLVCLELIPPSPR